MCTYTYIDACVKTQSRTEMSRMAGYARLGGPMNLNGHAGTKTQAPTLTGNLR
jgi:hypothetical protein